MVRQWTINQTLAIYEMFGSSAQVGVVQYSYKPPDYLGIPITNSDNFEIPFTLGECVDNDTCIIDGITNMPYLSSSTYTYYGLRRVSEVEFPRSSGYPNSTKVILVLTDGRANDVANLSPWWEQYGQTGDIIPFAIGVGNYEEFSNQLRTIANGGADDTRVFGLDSFENLNSLDIANEIASGIP